MIYYLLTLFILAAVNHLQATVNDVTGDTGTAQSGSLVISGGTSGAKFDSTSTTIAQSFNFLSLPVTSSTNGQILIDSQPALHSFGDQNFFVGTAAGNFTVTGGQNTGCGPSTLSSLTSGASNTAIGHACLTSLTEGTSNIVIGEGAGLSLTTGSSNVLIGESAGSAYTAGETGNIIIGANPGVASENHTIRIGDGGTQTDCYCDGIFGATVSSDTGLNVFVDDQGKLGTIVSSAKFKDIIRNIGNDSTPIFNLRPVSFILKSDKSKTKQFGLIAEEVYKVMPDLVVKDKKGDPYAVRYHELPVLLLNEIQKMENRIDKLEKQLQRAANYIEKLESRLNN